MTNPTPTWFTALLWTNTEIEVLHFEAEDLDRAADLLQRLRPGKTSGPRWQILPGVPRVTVDLCREVVK